MLLFVQIDLQHLVHAVKRNRSTYNSSEVNIGHSVFFFQEDNWRKDHDIKRWARLCSCLEIVCETGCNPSDIKIKWTWALCNTEYFVYTISNKIRSRMGPFYCGITVWILTLEPLVHVMRKEGKHAAVPFWKMPHCRQCCIVSHEKMQCDSYNHNSRGSFLSHQVFSKLLFSLKKHIFGQATRS